jgi:hypothetical protein
MTTDSLPAPDAPLGPQLRDPADAPSAFTVLRTRFFPDAPLGRPCKPFAETFSAEDVLIEAFHLGSVKRERLAAATDSHTDA